MHPHVKVILTGTFILACFLTGCMNQAIVDYDSDVTAKIDTYECFVVDTSKMEGSYEDLVFSPIAQRRFKLAIQALLKERGYTYDCLEADFVVQFYTTKRTVSRLDFNYPVYSGRFYNYGLFAYPGYVPPPHFDQYDEGTFVIDIIDIESTELVWRGIYVERLGRNPHKDKEVGLIVRKILAQFPPTR